MTAPNAPPPDDPSRGLIDSLALIGIGVCIGFAACLTLRWLL